MRSPLLAVVLLGAALLASGPSTAFGSGCIPSLGWNGLSYLGLSVEEPLVHGEPVGVGTRPACPGVNGWMVPARDVQLRSIPLVPARVAVAVEGDTASVWAAAGFFVQHRSHPLAGRFRTMPPPGKLRCGRDVRVRGEVPRQPSPYEPLRLRRGWVEVRVDARTRFRGRRLEGLPYVDMGDTILVQGQDCRRLDHDVRVIRPRTIRITPRP